MKALALLTAAALTFLSVAGCASTLTGTTARAKPRRRQLLLKARRAIEGASHCAGPFLFEPHRVERCPHREVSGHHSVVTISRQSHPAIACMIWARRQ
jgi:hypothetical protein